MWFHSVRNQPAPPEYLRRFFCDLTPAGFQQEFFCYVCFLNCEKLTSYRVVPSDLFCILTHPPEFWCTPIIPLFPGGCIELVVYFPGMPYLIMEPFLHVDTLLATFLFHRILLSLFPNLQILLCHAAKTLFIDNFKERILIPVQRFSNPFNRLNPDHKLLIWIFTIIE